MSKNALPDLNFSEMFGDSVSRVTGTTLVPGVSVSVYTEAFNALCADKKIDPEKITIQDLTKSQKSELLRRVVIIALKRGHSKKNVFAILSRSGITLEANQIKVWNSAIKFETARAFKQVFCVDPSAVDPKAAVSHILKGNCDAKYIHSTKKGKTTNLLAAIGFGPYVDIRKRFFELAEFQRSIGDTPSEESVEKCVKEYDSIQSDLAELYEKVDEMAAEVNETVRTVFGAKQRATKDAEFSVDDRLLAAMTIGGKVIMSDSDVDSEPADPDEVVLPD